MQDPPIVLHVAPKEGLPQATFRFAAGQLHAICVRIVGQKVLHACKAESAILSEVHEVVGLHSLEGKPELQRVAATCHKCIIVKLEGIPTNDEVWKAADSTIEIRPSGNDQKRRRPPWHGPQRSVSGQRVDGVGSVRNGVIAAETEANRIQHGRTEDMRFLDARESTRVLVDKMQVVQRIRLREICGVVEKGTCQTIAARKVMIDLAGVEVFVPYLVGRHAIISYISRGIQSGIWKGPKGQIPRRGRIDCHISGGEYANARVR